MKVKNHDTHPDEVNEKLCSYFTVGVHIILFFYYDLNTI